MDLDNPRDHQSDDYQLSVLDADQTSRKRLTYDEPLLGPGEITSDLQKSVVPEHAEIAVETEGVVSAAETPGKIQVQKKSKRFEEALPTKISAAPRMGADRTQ